MEDETQQQLYLVHQPSPDSFVVAAATADEANLLAHRVDLATHSCSCGAAQQSFCGHVAFVAACEASVEVQLQCMHMYKAGHSKHVN